MIEEGKAKKNMGKALSRERKPQKNMAKALIGEAKKQNGLAKGEIGERNPRSITKFCVEGRELPSQRRRHSSRNRRIPATRSNPASTVAIHSIPWSSITTARSASRDEMLCVHQKIARAVRIRECHIEDERTGDDEEIVVLTRKLELLESRIATPRLPQHLRARAQRASGSDFSEHRCGRALRGGREFARSVTPQSESVRRPSLMYYLKEVDVFCHSKSAVVIILFVSLFTAAHPSGSLAQTRPAKVLRVGYIPIAECAHLYVAISKKYFEAEGLLVELQAMKGGANILPALQTGDLDVGFSNVVSLALLDSQLPATDPEFLQSLAGGTYERAGFTNHALLTRPGSGITVRDFARPGLRVALNTQRNVEDLMLHAFLRKHGITATALTIVPLGFPEMLQALDKGAVDVISEVEPFIQPPVRANRAVVIAKQYQDVAPQTLVATYAVTLKWLTAHKAEANKFRRAIEKADAFIHQNDAETRQIIGSFTRIAQTDLPVIGLPRFEKRADEASLRAIVVEMQKQGYVKAVPSARQMLTP